jgi:hypothetical protein
VTLSGQLLAQLVSQHVRVGVQDLGIPFVGCIAKHKALVSSTNIFFLFIDVYRSSNLTGLTFNSLNHITGVAVEAAAIRVEADAPGDLTSDLLKVYLILGNANFT